MIILYFQFERIGSFQTMMLRTAFSLELVCPTTESQSIQVLCPVPPELSLPFRLMAMSSILAPCAPLVLFPLFLVDGSPSGVRVLFQMHALPVLCWHSRGGVVAAVLSSALLPGALSYSILATSAFRDCQLCLLSSGRPLGSVCIRPPVLWPGNPHKAVSWDNRGLTWFVSHLRGIAVLCCLVLISWRPLFHIFCPVFSLF